MKRKWLIAGILIAIEVLLCVGIIAIGWTGVDDLKTEGFRIRVFHADLASAEADEEWVFSADGDTILDLDSSAGDIQVRGGDTDEIRIIAHKTAWGATRTRAESALEDMTVTATQSDNKITIRYQQDPKIVIGGSTRSDRVDFVITVPTNTSVTASTSTGEVSLSDVDGKADLHSDFGDINATNISEELKANTNSGKIIAQQITAGKGTVDLRSDFGDISLENAIGGKIEAHSNSGKIIFGNVDASADMVLSSDFGEIEFESGSAKELMVHANSGNITLTQIKIKVLIDAHSDFGDIRLEAADCSTYLLDTNSGEIFVDGVSGAMEAHSDFGDLEITGGKNATLNLDSNSGSITYSGTLGNGPHSLKTDFGSIHMFVPEDTAVSFDFETDFGDIHSDFPLTLTGDIKEDHWQGTINGGGADLIVNTNSGDISIETNSP